MNKSLGIYATKTSRMAFSTPFAGFMQSNNTRNNKFEGQEIENLNATKPYEILCFSLLFFFFLRNLILPSLHFSRQEGKIHRRFCVFSFLLQIVSCTRNAYELPLETNSEKNLIHHSFFYKFLLFLVCFFNQLTFGFVHFFLP